MVPKSTHVAIFNTDVALRKQFEVQGLKFVNSPLERGRGV